MTINKMLESIVDVVNNENLEDAANIVRKIVCDYLGVEKPKTKLIINSGRFLKVKSGLKYPFYTEYVQELYIPMCTIQAIIELAHDDSDVKLTVQELQKIRKRAKVDEIENNKKADGKYKISAAAKFALITIGGLVLSGYFVHEGIEPEDVYTFIRNKVKTVVSTIQENGGKVLLVDVDSVLYVGNEILVEGTHQERHRTVVVMPTGQYLTFSSHRTGGYMNKLSDKDLIKIDNNITKEMSTK